MPPSLIPDSDSLNVMIFWSSDKTDEFRTSPELFPHFILVLNNWLIDWSKNRRFSLIYNGIIICLDLNPFPTPSSLLFSLSFHFLSPQHLFIPPSVSAVVGSSPPRANRISLLTRSSAITHFLMWPCVTPRGCGSSAVRSPNSTNCVWGSRSVELSTLVSFYSAAAFQDSYHYFSWWVWRREGEFLFFFPGRLMLMTAPPLCLL